MGASVPSGCTGAAEEVGAYVSKVRDGDAGVGEEAAADLGVVGAASSGGSGEGLVGVVAIAEPAAETSDLVVAEVRGVIGELEDDIGRDVVGVVGGEVVETTAGACIADEEVRVGIGAGVDDGSLLNRDSSGQAAELLLKADAGLTLPAETDMVLGVDGCGKVFGAVVCAGLGFSHE
jgi:hypothetical protein